MAPPINVQDWYGDRHTCQIASGALDHTVIRKQHNIIGIKDAAHEHRTNVYRPKFLYYYVLVFFIYGLLSELNVGGWMDKNF